MFGKRAKKQSTDDFEGTEADFSEDFAAHGDEDNSFVESDNGWEDETALGGDDVIEPELRDRRRSPLAKVLPFVTLGVLAAGGAGYYYVNYMQPPAAAPAPAVIAAAPAGDTEVAAVPAAEPATTPDSGTSEPTSEATAETAPPMVAPAPQDAAEGMLQPAEPVASAPTDIQPDTTATETPAVTTAEPVATTAPEPVVAAEPTPAAVVEPVVQVPSEPAPVMATTPAVSPAVPAITDEKLADLSERMDVIEHQIGDLTKAIDRMAAQPAVTAQPVAAATDDKLTDTVTALQEQVRKLQADLAAVKNTPRAPAPVATAPAPQAPRAATRTATAPRPQTTAPAEPVVRWTLRAAQSNEAWISRSAEGELKSVTVGDTLSGIGRITAIRQTASGAWEVVGTTGSIRQ